jgi:hypothetical protein
MKYSIRIQYPDGVAYMAHRDKTAWTKRTAIKYATEWNRQHPDLPAQLEPA